MSRVTNLICVYELCPNGRDFELLEVVNGCFGIYKPRLVHVEDPVLPSGWCCNGKALECNVAIGAFNYLNLDDLVKKLKLIDYDEFGCDYLQLIVNEQEDDRFRIINIYSFL